MHFSKKKIGILILLLVINAVVIGSFIILTKKIRSDESLQYGTGAP